MTPFILAHSVAAIADLSGDGKMEIVLYEVYYEGRGGRSGSMSTTTWDPFNRSAPAAGVANGTISVPSLWRIHLSTGSLMWVTPESS